MLLQEKISREKRGIAGSREPVVVGPEAGTITPR